MNRLILISIIVISFISCKSLSVNKELQQTTDQNLQLGTIGEQNYFVLEQDYNQTALPKYQEPVKVQVNAVSFNKATYKAYEKAKLFQNKTIVVNYIDSVKMKPNFLKLEIADRLTVLNSLNGKENKDVFQFLKNKNESHIVTSISIAFNDEINKVLNKADEVFLEKTDINSYVLKIYKNKKEQQIIRFNEGIVFAYQTSNACWKQNDKYQLKIVDIVESNDKCPSKTYRSSKQANKKINYFKF